MGHNTFFQFKQFRVVQEKAAMKVGTDGVLLGAWTNTDACKKILDVGTGTGLIALMLAQRSAAEITAIEIEDNAASEATKNVVASPWQNRIEVKHISFQDFVGESSAKFDLIVSNPPFFECSQKSTNASRTTARHNDSLPFRDLISCAVGLLSKKGRLAVILPVEPAQHFIEMAKSHQLNLNRITKVSPDERKEPLRYLMEFSTENILVADNLAIRSYHQNDYSLQYKTLCKDFYLLF